MSASSHAVLVTGGSGFLGEHLVRALLRSGAMVRNLDFKSNSFSHPGLNHWAGTFTDEALLREAMAGVDVVFHLAATGFAREANLHPHQDCTDNIGGTIRIAERAAEAGVRRLVFASSGGTVYGPAAELPIAETHPTNPITAYGISKLACEKYLRFFDGKSGLQTLSLRIANPYGPGQNLAKAQGALTTFCKHAAEGDPIEIWGDGTVERDFIAVADVTHAFLAAMESESHGIEINIGSGGGTSLNRLLDVIESALGRPVTRHYLPARSFDVSRNHLDITRAARVLGWRPKVGLVDGVSEMLAHFGAT